MASSTSSRRQSHDNNNSISEVLSSIDILTLVAQFLANHDLIDLIHFAQVCESWHQAAATLQRLQGSSMPWLFSFDKSTWRFGLSDIWSLKQNCSRELRISPELQNFNHSPGLPICTSKTGWLLLSKYVDFSIEFLFCNPFHNKIIELPCLYLDVGEDVDKFMINSTHPALASRNSDCVVAIISRGKYYRLVTCNPRTRNKKWTSHMISVEHVNPDRNVWCSTYMKGTLYCVCGFRDWHDGETMGMFSIANQDSGVRVHYSSLQLEWFDHFELFESNGELLLASHDLRIHNGWCWRVYKFDPLRKDGRNQWSPIESLGNRALAISTWPCGFSRDKVVVVQEAKELADMIIDGNTTYTRNTDERGSIWIQGKYHYWNFMRPSVTYIEPFL